MVDATCQLNSFTLSCVTYYNLFIAYKLRCVVLQCKWALVHVLSTDPSPPRDLTITRVFQHGIELNWIPPRETNGDIQHYIIKYTTQDGTEQEINTTDNTNYYNLTGLERGQIYNNIRVVAVNSAGPGGGSGAIASYTHSPAGSTGNTTESECQSKQNISLCVSSE